MTVAIRRAALNDLRPAAAMQERAWRESHQGLLGPSLVDDLESGINGVSGHWGDLVGAGQDIWIVTDGTEIVGVCHVGAARDDDAPAADELTMLYLLEKAQGTGVAAELLATAAGDRPVYLWVVKGNARAIAFYEKEGFVADGATRPVAGMTGAVELRMVRGTGA